MFISKKVINVKYSTSHTHLWYLFYIQYSMSGVQCMQQEVLFFSFQITQLVL